eukprot:15341929-Ditylum_brightwellii.AAC.1
MGVHLLCRTWKSSSLVHPPHLPFVYHTFLFGKMYKEHTGAQLQNRQSQATFRDDLVGTSSSWVESIPAYYKILTKGECFENKLSIVWERE